MKRTPRQVIADWMYPPRTPGLDLEPVREQAVTPQLAEQLHRSIVSHFRRSHHDDLAPVAAMGKRAFLEHMLAINAERGQK